MASHPAPLQVGLRFARFLALLLSLPIVGRAQPQDGMRTVDVTQYGVVVRAPAAWRLIRWGDGDTAFQLRLPQEEASATGSVSCVLAIPSENLQQLKRRIAASDEQAAADPKSSRKLIKNELQTLDAQRFGRQQADEVGERLISVWEHSDVGNGDVGNGDVGGASEGYAAARKRFEMSCQLVHAQTLYHFTLLTDEAHFEAYRLEFEDLLAGAKFSPPQTGLQRLPGGFWLQREFRFALQLPAGWQPAFGASDKALLAATGAAHAGFFDRVTVTASAARPLDLDQLAKSLPETLAKTDPTADLATSRMVRHQGAGRALETVVHARRESLPVTILQRRFSGGKRNYDIKFGCEAEAFKKLEADLQRALDSFQEVADKEPDGVL